MAGFKGGLPQFKKPKFVARNAENKGGVPGAKKARLDAGKRKNLEKIVSKKEKFGGKKDKAEWVKE